MPETARKLPEEIRRVYLALALDPGQLATAQAELEELAQTMRQAEGGLGRRVSAG